MKAWSMFWCYCWPQNGILDKSAQIGWTWHSKTYLFFGIDHHDVLVQRWALDVIWSITMAHFVGQTKASSGFAVLLERLLSLHDRSRGQGQGMMSKSDPSVTCYWYDITRDTSTQWAFVSTLNPKLLELMNNYFWIVSSSKLDLKKLHKGTYYS